MVCELYGFLSWQFCIISVRFFPWSSLGQLILNVFLKLGDLPLALPSTDSECLSICLKSLFIKYHGLPVGGF